MLVTRREQDEIGTPGGTGVISQVSRRHQSSLLVAGSTTVEKMNAQSQVGAFSLGRDTEDNLLRTSFGASEDP